MLFNLHLKQFQYLYAMKFSEIIAVVLISVLCSFSAFSQEVELDHFTVFQHDDEVYLSWTISRGSNCNGIGIERSTDNSMFEEIGYIPGICGNANFAQPFSFIDPAPAGNYVNYYRLKLGLQGYSDTTSIEFLKITDQGFRIYPNPATDQTEVVFQNQRSETHELEIFSLTGRLVHRITTIQNTIPIDTHSFSPGYYLIRLTNSNNQQTFTEKLIIAAL